MMKTKMNLKIKLLNIIIDFIQLTLNNKIKLIIKEKKSNK